ncbi:MAG: hypothetical protein U1E74_10285 [Paenacidovorax caeni]
MKSAAVNPGTHAHGGAGGHRPGGSLHRAARPAGAGATQFIDAGVGAINVGARMGVAGQPMAVPVLRAERYALLDALQNMQVTLTDAQGAVLGRGKGSDILEHPLNAVVWLAQALQQEGIALQPGDLVSSACSRCCRPSRGQRSRPPTRGCRGRAAGAGHVQVTGGGARWACDGRVCVFFRCMMAGFAR